MYFGEVVGCKLHLIISTKITIVLMCDLNVITRIWLGFMVQIDFINFQEGSDFFHFIYKYTSMFILSNLFNFHSVTYFRFYIVPTFNFCSIGITL